MKLHVTHIHIITLNYSVTPPSSRTQNKSAAYPLTIHTPTHSFARMGHTTNPGSHTLALTPPDMCSQLLKITKKNAWTRQCALNAQRIHLEWMMTSKCQP